MDKILTICIPTYNRSKCIVEQLNRLNMLSDKSKECIDIFVSDNCSTDDTQDKILEFKKLNNMNFVYNRNPGNLGPDGNFVTCFLYAKTKYVWVLGDDDYLIIDNLEKLIDFLVKTREKDYGLVHVRFEGKGIGDFQEYADSNLFIQDIGIWSTFISGNIVNTKFVPQIDFDKYLVTFFSYVPLYIKAALKSPDNLMVNISVFSTGADMGTNGGYNLFQVFVTNLLEIYHEFLGNGMTDATYEHMRNCVLNFVMPFIYRLLIKREKTGWASDKGWTICFKEFGVPRVLWKVCQYEAKRVWHKTF